MWHIWDARNKLREDEVFMHPHAVAAKIKAYIDMILLHLYKASTNHRREPSSSSPKWVPPPEGTVLVNGDAAILASTRKMGVGVVVHDHNGKFIAACGERVDEVITPEMAEELVVRRVSFSLENGFPRVTIGSNCWVAQRKTKTFLRDTPKIKPR
jgi:hypothetical protein